MSALGSTEKCGLCGREIGPERSANLYLCEYQCRTCGRVKITEEAKLQLPQTLQGNEYLLSGFTREREVWGLAPVTISSENIHRLIDDANKPTNVVGKLDRLVDYLGTKSDYPGKPVGLVPYFDYPLVYAKNPEEFEYLLEQLFSLGWVKKFARAFEDESHKGRSLVLSVDGWKHLIETSSHRRRTDQAFVAMWFNSQMDLPYKEGIERAVREAGFKALRVDMQEHNDQIDDFIIAEIRKSAFLVADFTGHRGGVYYEAGFAHGLDIPVIFTCRADQFDQVHFDTRQYPHIKWEKETDLYEKLLNRINATIVHRF